MNKTIVLATDHAGFELKEHVKTFLIEKGYDVKDFGAFEYDGLDDYPDFILPAAKYISKYLFNWIRINWPNLFASRRDTKIFT